MEKLFHLKEHGTDVRTEIIAGATTFMTMAYILAVNPAILSACGMDFANVFTATALASAIACFVMGFYANLPFALSAGMGLNAMFAYTVCLQMGYSWRWALSAVLVEGLIFIALTVTNVREAIINCIPSSLKKAISSGIGLFIAFVGLKNAGIIVADESNITALNPTWYKGAPLITLIGIVIMGVLLVKKVRGAVLLGILAATVIGIPFGITQYAGGSYIPPAPYFCEFAFSEIFADNESVTNFLFVVFTMLYFDIFDTVGTLIACSEKCGMIKEDGSIPSAKQALMADAIGTTAGAILGTSTVTTFAETSSGVSEGGRTGLTAITVGALFLLSLFFEPIFGSIPSAATAPALIIVGVMMFSPIKEMITDNFTEAIPFFLTIIMMVCSSSISNGILFGVLSYVILKVLTGHGKEMSFMTYVVGALFILKVLAEIFV